MKKLAVIGVKGLPGYGGAARSTESLLHQLKRDYEITVFSIDSHTSIHGDYKGLNQIVFKSMAFKRLNTFAYYLKSTWYCLFKANYDLVHVQHIYAGFIIPILKFKYKVVNTVRGIIPKDDNKWNVLDKFFFSFFEYASLKFSDEIASVCYPHIAYLQEIENREIHYIPNGVYIYNDLLSNKAETDYITFAAGRIISLKGLHLLLQALQAMKYKGKVKIIGSLEHVPGYRKQIISLSEGLTVEFLGLIKEKETLFEIIRDSKLFVFPSLNEGMSNMLLEAASFKTPILASDIIENKYVFDDSEVTFFQSDNYIDLKNKLEWMLINHPQIQKKALKAFEKLLVNHDWEKIADTYRSLYSKLLYSPDLTVNK